MKDVQIFILNINDTWIQMRELLADGYEIISAVSTGGEIVYILSKNINNP